MEEPIGAGATAGRPPQPTTPPVPVFLDESGRRRRIVRWAGAAVGVLFLGYIGLVAASFTRAPFVRQLALPGIGSPAPGNGANPRPPQLGTGAVAIPQPDLSVTIPASPATTAPAARTATPSGGTATTATTSVITTATTEPGSTPTTATGGAPVTSPATTTTTARGNGRATGRSTTTTTASTSTTRHGRP